jgi:hypothetical protein
MSTPLQSAAVQVAARPLDTAQTDIALRSMPDSRVLENVTPARLPVHYTSNAAAGQMVRAAGSPLVTRSERRTLIDATSAIDVSRRVLREEELTSISRTQSSVVDVLTTQRIIDNVATSHLAAATSNLSSTVRAHESSYSTGISIDAVASSHRVTAASNSISTVDTEVRNQDVVSSQGTHLTSLTAVSDAQSTSRSDQINAFHSSVDVRENQVSSSTQNVSCAQASSVAQSAAVSVSDALSLTSVRVHERDDHSINSLTVRDSAISDKSAVLVAVSDVQTILSTNAAVEFRPSSTADERESSDLARILAAIVNVQTDVQAAAKSISLLSAAQTASITPASAREPVGDAVVEGSVMMNLGGGTFNFFGSSPDRPALVDEPASPPAVQPRGPPQSLSAVVNPAAAATLQEAVQVPVHVARVTRHVAPVTRHAAPAHIAPVTRPAAPTTRAQGFVSSRLVAVAATQTRVLPRTVGTQTRTRVHSNAVSSQTAAPALCIDVASLACARTAEASTMMAHICMVDAATSPQTPPRSTPAVAPASPRRPQAPERAAGAAHCDATPPQTEPGGPANAPPYPLPPAPSLGSFARPLDDAWNHSALRSPIGGSPGVTSSSTGALAPDALLDDAVAATLNDLESEVARARAEATAARARAAELEDAVAAMSARLADIVLGTQDIASRDSIAAAEAADAEAAAFVRASAAATAQLLKTQSLGLVAAALRSHDGGDASDVARATIITDSDGRVLESSASGASCARTPASSPPAFTDVVAHARGFASSLRRSLSSSADGATSRETRALVGTARRGTGRGHTPAASAVALLRRASRADAGASGCVPGGSPGGSDALGGTETISPETSRSGRSGAEATISAVTAASAVSVLVGEASQLLGGGLATLRTSLARARLEAREATDSLAGAREELRRSALYKRAAVAAHKKLAHMSAGAAAGARKGAAPVHTQARPATLVDAWAIERGQWGGVSLKS